jgi:ankyrin repeat protein
VKNQIATGIVVIFIAASLHAQAKSFSEIVRTGTVQQIQAAIDQGADVNARDRDKRTPLMWAAQFSRNVEVVLLLLDAGAEVNARDKDGCIEELGP